MEKLNVAIADDNVRMADILGQMIEEDKDLTLVGKAHNGEEICSIIREKEPDVVVLDIIMPKMDGLTVMEHCSHDSSVKKQPAFIVVSAVGQERITEDAFNLGAYYYMLKPFDKQVLLSRIKHIRRGNERKMREPVRQAVREEPAPYGKRNLETDVTNIIHEIGVPAHSTIWMPARFPVPVCMQLPSFAIQAPPAVLIIFHKFPVHSFFLYFR